jgi:hypothetical protein
MKKNVAGQQVGAQMVSATNGAAFAGAVSVYITGDTFTQSLGGSASGVCEHLGNGLHIYKPVQSETNFDYIAFTFIGTGAVPSTVQVYTEFDSDVVKISGDATAADNLEAQYDGSGIIGSNYPAYQAQVRDIAVTGSALNTVATTFSMSYGTQTNSYTFTQLANQSYHQIAAQNAGSNPYNIDCYYEFNIGTEGVPVEVSVLGRLHEGSAPYGGDSVDTYAWDWVGSAWDHISPAAGDFVGSNSTTDVVKLMTLLTKHVGTGADDGKVRIRFEGNTLESGTILYIDQVLVRYANPLTQSGIANELLGSTMGTNVTEIKAQTDQLTFNGDNVLAEVGSVTISGTVLVGDVTLAATQPNYAPAKAGDEMALVAPYSALLNSTLSTIQESIDDLADSLSTIAPTTDAADSASVTYGTTIAGSYVNTQTDDNNPYTLRPAASGLDMTMFFEIGTGRAPVGVAINGYWNGSGQYCDVYAYDYLIDVWDKLSNSSTRMASRNSDADYSYPLNREHMDPATGQVKIRFVSASTNTAHRLYLDRVLVSTVQSETGTAPASISAQDVWDYATRTLTSDSGEPVDASEIAAAVRDVDNSAPAAGSLGEAINNAATGSSLSTVQDGVDALSSSMSEIAGYVDTLEASAASIEAYVDTVEGTLALLSVTLSDVLTEVQNVNSSLSDIDTNLDAVLGVAGKLDTAMEYDAGVFRFTENALELAPTASSTLTEAAIATAVWGAASRTLTSGAAGAGAITYVYTLTEYPGGDPIADADVWVTSDSAGTNVLASGRTDAYGQVTFYLDAGTVYVWRQKSGYNATNPDTETVPGSGAGTMTSATNDDGTVGFLDPDNIL